MGVIVLQLSTCQWMSDFITIKCVTVKTQIKKNLLLSPRPDSFKSLTHLSVCLRL